MREIATGLIQLGFEVETDFRCEDQSDGKGPYIAAWYSDKPQPSDAEIDQAIKAYEVEWKAQEYARKRQAEYPTIEDCVHAMLDGDLDELQAKRQAVKQKYPKGAS